MRAAAPGDGVLVRRIGHDGRIRQVRDNTYLRWRFNNPRASYRFCFLDRGRLRAYLVLQAWVGRGPGRVRILDWEGETPEDRRLVLTTSVQWIEDPCGVRCSVLTSADRAGLESVGFAEQSSRSVTDSHTARSRVPPGERVEGESWRLGEQDVLKVSNWDYRELYSDGS